MQKRNASFVVECKYVKLISSILTTNVFYSLAIVFESRLQGKSNKIIVYSQYLLNYETLIRYTLTSRRLTLLCQSLKHKNLLLHLSELIFSHSCTIII